MSLFVLAAAGLLAIILFVSVPFVLLAKLGLAGMLGALFVVHAAEAAIIVELVRSTIPRTARWSDRQHLAAVGLVWAALFACGGIVVYRAWPAPA